MIQINVGDRVAIYGTAEYRVMDGPKYSYLRGKKGEVVASPSIESGEIEVRTEDFIYTVHVKQCRKIKPKPKRESVLLTREKFAQIWDDIIAKQHGYSLSLKSESFALFCKAFGLGDGK